MCHQSRNPFIFASLVLLSTVSTSCVTAPPVARPGALVIREQGTLPLDQVAEGYRAMDERRAIKTLLRP